MLLVWMPAFARLSQAALVHALRNLYGDVWEWWIIYIFLFYDFVLTAQIGVRTHQIRPYQSWSNDKTFYGVTQ